MAIVNASVLLDRRDQKQGHIHRLLPSGAVCAIVAMTVLGLALRVYLLTRPGLLTSGTIEYDDGVYLGAALRLLQGVPPYRDYAFVQPPGILILSLPAALAGRMISTVTGLVVARLLTVCASVACIPLAGCLVRHRGTSVTLVTCGFLALYPADVLASRTLLLEPWMNLCCLLGANAAFRRGRLAEPRRLAVAGAALGFAVAVKYWAVIPAFALAAGCLTRPGRPIRRYATGLGLGFALPVAPFALASPSGFVRGTVLDQVTRAGSGVPLRMRLAYLTGLVNMMNRHGTVTLGPVSHSLFARASTGTTSPADTGWLPAGLTALGIAVLAFAYWRRRDQRSQLEWFALATAAASAIAILAYSAFFYHYPAFTGPWLAIATGTAAGALTPDSALARRLALGAAAIAITALAIQQASDTGQVYVPPNPPVAALIPAGACVVTDQVSLTIAANRFTTTAPGCPDVVDSLATTLSLGNGTSVQGGAARLPNVVAAWRSDLGRARYVWLATGSGWRIPWPASMKTWFNTQFRLIRPFPGSALYVRAGDPHHVE